MKKQLAAILCLALLASMSACAASAQAAPEEAPAPETTVSVQTHEQIDVDLTKLNSTILFSQTYAMLSEPTPYLGKVVRMRGSYVVYADGAKACLISDEGGCCQEGIHFALRDGIAYPELNTQIIVVGTFGTYEFNGVTYCRLYDAILEE